MADDHARFHRLIDEVLSELGFSLDTAQRGLLYQHFALLRLWSRKVNLTAIRDYDEVVWRHFGESLAVAKVVGSGTGAVVDIGSGAGFPGIPVAIRWPTRKVSLVESAGKKVTFLKEVARGVRNVQVFEGRLEQFEGHVEFAVIRGVAAAKLGQDVVRVASRIVMLTSSVRAGAVVRGLGLERVAEEEIPWDPRTKVLSGWTTLAGGST